jgi:predicted nucleotidyltransferase
LAEYGGALQPLESLVKTLKDGLKAGGAEKALLYGSIAKGTENPDSDIDLLIVAGDEKGKKQLEPHLAGLEKQCLKLYGNPLSAVVLTEKEYEAGKNKQVIKDAEKGIKII